MICYDCLGSFAWLNDDKGFKVCQRCFGKRYRVRKKNTCDDGVCYNPTWLDLKKKWERKG